MVLGSICAPVLRLAVVAAAGLAASGCAQNGANPGDLISLAQAKKPATKVAAANDPTAELRKATRYWAKAFAKNPRDAKAAVAYARNLKALGSRRHALAILQRAAIHNSHDRALASEYGRLALEFGQISVAQKLLASADDPTNPDWRVISARGAVLAKLGRHKQSIAFFERARNLAPDHPSVLNNLALAYIADGRPSVAEPLLRTAVASKGARPKIRQNLVLALGLQGKYDEAKRIAATDLSQDKAKASVAYLRKIVKLPPKAMPVAVPIPVAVAAKATRKAKAGAKVATLPPIIVQPQDRRPSLRGTARASKVARGKVAHGAIAQVGRPIQLTPTQR
jgi:Flp pilus assembly protein TadD